MPVETVKKFNEKKNKWIVTALNNTIKKKWSANCYRNMFKSTKHKSRAYEKIVIQINRMVWYYIGKLCDQKMIPLQEKRFTEERKKELIEDILFINGYKNVSVLKAISEFQLPKRTIKRGRKRKTVEHQAIKRLVKIFKESTNLTVDGSCGLVSDLLTELDENKKNIIYKKIDFSNLKFQTEDVRSIYYRK